MYMIVYNVSSSTRKLFLQSLQEFVFSFYVCRIDRLTWRNLGPAQEVFL